jgi:hypothetical protein
MFAVMGTTGRSIAGAVVLGLMCCASTARAERPLYLDRPDLHAHFWLSYGLALTTTEVLEGPEPQWGPSLGTGMGLAISTGAVGALGLFEQARQFEAHFAAVFEREGGFQIALGLAPQALFQAHPTQRQQQLGVIAVLLQPLTAPPPQCAS